MTDPLKVRWTEFSHTTDWKPCLQADVRGEVLVISYGGGSQDMIPLHVIRGTIEVRPNEEATS